MRTYGAGSVREVRTGRYAGWWAAEWELPRDDQGRRRRRRILRQTENEARRAMRAEMRKSSTSRHGGERLDDFLRRWLDDVVSVTRRERTLVGYRQIIENHIIPAFGARDIGAIMRRDVQRWVSGLTLHPTTIRHIVACFGAAYAYAVTWELVAVNPVAKLDLPAVPKRIVRAMTPADARKVLDAVKESPVETIVTVALWTGLRQGELLGLRWADVDLDGATVAVNSSLSRLPGRNAREGMRYVLTAPKSDRSIRTVPLAPDAVRVLRAEKKRQMAEDRTNRYGLVFFLDADAPLDGPALTYEFQAVLKSAGLPKMRFHDLRHGCATLLIASGMPLAFVSKVMGHSSINVTVDIYGHLDESVAREGINRMVEAMA